MNFLKVITGNKQLSFITLTAAVIVWLVCFPLFQDGMFMDGVQYAAVSCNLARGVGSFWFPVFSENSIAGLDTFHEHPPLVFFLQSIFFKIFGLHNIYSERIYCLVMLLLTGFFIVKIWQKVFNDDAEIQKLFWLPILLWLIIPVVFWSYAHNIQENTMGFFTTAAVYFFLLAVNARNVFTGIHFYTGVFCVACAMLSKGIPGLFPLVFFAFHFLVYRKNSFSLSFAVSVVMIVVLAAAFWAILLIPDAKASLSIWFFDRMLYRIENNPVVENHFKILFNLFAEQLPALFFCASIISLGWFRKFPLQFNKKHFWFFFLLGCAGSLPLLLTLVQRTFYFTPALPFFALALAVIIAPSTNYFSEKLFLNKKLWHSTFVLAAIIFLTGVIFTVYYAGKPKRSPEMLYDVYSIGKQIPENTTVCVSGELMWNNWAFRCYMMRYNSISFAVSDTCRYRIDYIKVNNELSRFQVTSTDVR